MKKLLIIFMFLPVFVFGQYKFVNPTKSPGAGTVHINDGMVGDSFEDIKRGVFNFYVVLPDGNRYGSSGCLINQYTLDGIPKQYFVSSLHCFKTGDMCGGSEFDYAKKTVEFYFNYQSPKDNLGKFFEKINTDSCFKFTSKVRKIADVGCVYGDFFLGEILEPIPPHYNVFYAGWATGFSEIDNFSNISHPLNSLKAFANTSFVFEGLLGSVSQKSCNALANTIDAIRCWKRNCKKSSASLCQYVAIPLVEYRYRIKYWNNGKVYKGSSGSPLLNHDKRIIGTLSGEIAETWFGKFKSYYYNGNIRGNLNPQYSSTVDYNGIPGLSRNVFTDINYTDKSKYNFYPAKLYQKQNEIILTAKNDVNLGDSNTDLVIEDQAHYTFRAVKNSSLEKVTVQNGATLQIQSGEKVSLKSGFKVEKGGSFSARVAQFTVPSSQRKIAAEEQEKMDLFARMQSIQIPSSYDITSELLANQMFVELQPNPASEVVSLKFGYLPQDHLKITVLNSMGQNVFVQEVKGIKSNAKHEISVENLETGLYQFILDIGDSRVVKKIAIEK